HHALSPSAERAAARAIAGRGAQRPRHDDAAVQRQRYWGLEVMDRAGRWVPVPVIEGAFTVNLGDLMMRWTNDRWRSTLHRVVNPPQASDELSQRLSIGMFFIPNYDAVVAPITEFGRASKYPPITVVDYRTSRFASTASEAAAD